MFAEFSVANYRSYRERGTLSMVAAPIRSKDKRLDADNIFEARPRLNLLTSAIIYGANASGKSNLVSALAFMRRFVLQSSAETSATRSIEVEPFLLDTESSDRPTTFEIVLIAEGRQYRYGFEADQRRVHKEWLFHVPAVREARLFEREGEQVLLSDAFAEGRGLATRTRPNALFLSVVAQWNGAIAQRLVTWFADTLALLSALPHRAGRAATVRALQDETQRDAVVAFIRNLDLAILDVKLREPVVDAPVLSADGQPASVAETARVYEYIRRREMELAPDIQTVHQRFDREGKAAGEAVFDLARHESDGTHKIFALAGLLVNTLRSGRVMVADEFDARLHPTLTRALIELFNSPAANPGHAQLVITTQDTNLLDNRLFRRDQIWFTEKDRFGTTDLYSLAEHKGVRNDASYEKDYIHGRYGAIPYPGDLRTALGDRNGEAA
jgi:AAA15 family ATPase/GTPase